MDRVEKALQRAEAIYGLCTTQGELRRLAELAHNAEFIVEVGAYMGRSTMALTSSDGFIFSVDTWRGSEEDEEGEKTKEVPFDVVYGNYLKNLWGEIISGRVIHLCCDSVQAAKHFEKMGYNFDLIFLDAGHDYEWVTRDIINWLPLLNQGGVMVGHDLPHPEMTRALDDTIPGWIPSVGMLWEYVK